MSTVEFPAGAVVMVAQSGNTPTLKYLHRFQISKLQSRAESKRGMFERHVLRVQQMHRRQPLEIIQSLKAG